MTHADQGLIHKEVQDGYGHGILRRWRQQSSASVQTADAGGKRRSKRRREEKARQGNESKEKEGNVVAVMDVHTNLKLYVEW